MLKDKPLTQFFAVVPGVVIACILASLHLQEAVVGRAQSTSERASRVDIDPLVALTHSTLRQCLAEPPEHVPAVPRTLRPEPVWLKLSASDQARPFISDGSPYVVLVGSTGKVERVWPVFSHDVSAGSTAYHEAVIGALARLTVPAAQRPDHAPSCLVLAPRTA